ncbi:MAG: hypothetical protein JNK79_11730 [Chitinophagaceae bacterium]|nr:hypothetical protein [Chitinophagaceae bacterium]
MKHLLTILFLICTLSLFSQQNNLTQEGDGGRIEALKIAYITKKLNLSPDEAQRFWPIYNNYANEMRQVRREQRRDNASELDTEEKYLRIRKKYNTEFSRALNPDKVNTFFRSEKDFGNIVQKELSERRQLRQGLINKERQKR